MTHRHRLVWLWAGGKLVLRIVAHLVSSVGFSLYGSKAYTTAYSFSAVCVVVCTHTVKPYTVYCVRVLSGSDLGLSSHVGRVLGPCLARPAGGPEPPPPAALARHRQGGVPRRVRDFTVKPANPLTFYFTVKFV